MRRLICTFVVRIWQNRFSNDVARLICILGHPLLCICDTGPLLTWLILFLDVDECAANVTNPCANNGTCMNSYGSYYCVCANGWTGVNCTIGKTFMVFLLYSVLLCKYFLLLGPVTKWLRTLIFSALNCSSSPRCWFEPNSGHMWNKPSSACRWSGGFLGDLQFLPHLTIDSAQNEWNNLDWL